MTPNIARAVSDLVEEYRRFPWTSYRFLDERLRTQELRPDLLFPDDAELADRLSSHPALLWKAQNAREHAAGRRGSGRPRRT